jgi:hypothetical protein
MIPKYKGILTMEAADYLGKRFARDPFIVSRKIASKFILVPIRQRAREVQNIYNMNEIGGFIWELLDGKRRVEQVRDIVVDEFEVESKEAEADLVEFMKQLEKIDVVREVQDGMS